MRAVLRMMIQALKAAVPALVLFWPGVALAEDGGFDFTKLGFLFSGIGLFILMVLFRFVWEALSRIIMILGVTAILALIVWVTGVFSFEKDQKKSEEKVASESAAPASLIPPNPALAGGRSESDALIPPIGVARTQGRAPTASLMNAADTAQQVFSGAVQVLDGDTLVVQGQTVRLHGIDAPELDQTCKNPRGLTYECGVQARTNLSSFVGVQPVQCQTVDRDPSGLHRVYCTMNGTDIAAAMVFNGFAYATTPEGERYRPMQIAAQQEGKGFWIGAFEPPATWRSTQ